MLETTKVKTSDRATFLTGSMKDRALSLVALCLLLSTLGCSGEPKIRFKDGDVYPTQGQEVHSVDEHKKVYPLGEGEEDVYAVTPQDEDVYPKEIKPFIPTTYLIGPGDELEVLYHIDPGYTVDDYLIDTEDVLRIEFYYYPTLARTIKVRPDGKITLPLIGDVKASKLRPAELADYVSKLYTPILNRPNATVEVEGFYAKVEELKKAITTQNRGQSRLVVVRPDGSISLPYVGDVQAVNLTAHDVSKLLGEKYSQFIQSMSVTVAVLNARSNQAYIMGQVTKPNFFAMTGPTTLTQIISMAGGFTNDANTRQVVIISRNSQGQPEGRMINMDEIIGKGYAGADIMIKQYDVVFVPKTGLSKAALFGDQLWRLIPLNFTINGNYSFGGETTR